MPKCATAVTRKLHSNEEAPYLIPIRCSIVSLPFKNRIEIRLIACSMLRTYKPIRKSHSNR